MVFTEHTGLNNLYTMLSYCINEVECRRVLIAKSFGEKWSPEDCSVGCDVCKKLQIGNSVGTPLPTTSAEKVTSKCYTVTRTDVSHYCKDLVLIVEHHQAIQQRVTAAKVVDIWRGQGGSSRPSHLPSISMPAEQCERVLVSAILQGVLKEEFHFTAYSTISYVGLGRKANSVKRGLVKVELSSLSISKGRAVCSRKGTETEPTTDDSSPITVPANTIPLPSMLPCKNITGLLSVPKKTEIQGQAQSPVPSTIDLPVQTGNKDLVSLGKGKKRKVPSENQSSPKCTKRMIPTDIIEIDD